MIAYGITVEAYIILMMIVLLISICILQYHNLLLINNL